MAKTSIWLAASLLLFHAGCDRFREMINPPPPTPPPVAGNSLPTTPPPTTGPPVEVLEITPEMLRRARVYVCTYLDAAEFRQYAGSFPLTQREPYIVLGKAILGGQEYSAKIDRFMSEPEPEHPIQRFLPAIEIEGKWVDLWIDPDVGDGLWEENAEKIISRLGSDRSIDISVPDGIFPEHVQFKLIVQPSGEIRLSD